MALAEKYGKIAIITKASKNGPEGIGRQARSCCDLSEIEVGDTTKKMYRL